MTDIYYSAARLKTREKKLFTQEDFDALLNLGNMEDVYRFLSDRGIELHYDAFGKPDRTATLEAYQESCFAFVADCVSDADFIKIWQLPYDCNNLKAGLKAEYRNIDGDFMLSSLGSIPLADMKEIILHHDFAKLPNHLETAAEEALTAFAKTKNPQVLDFILDKACYEDMLSLAEHPVLKNWVMAKIDLTNILICMRVAELRLGDIAKSLLAKTLLPGGKLEINNLIRDIQMGEDAFVNKMEFTEYRNFARDYSAGEKNLSRAEKCADDCFMSLLQEAKLSTDGEVSVSAYLLAAENEVKNLRILLAGLESSWSSEMLKERKRLGYV